MDKNTKLTQLFQDPSFKKEAEGIKTAEEMQALFAKHGVDYSLDEVYALCEAIAKRMEASNEEGELTEDALEDVAGGIAIGLIIFGVGCVGAAALGIYNGYKSTKKAHT